PSGSTRPGVSGDCLANAVRWSACQPSSEIDFDTSILHTTGISCDRLRGGKGEYGTGADVEASTVPIAGDGALLRVELAAREWEISVGAVVRESEDLVAAAGEA